MVEVACEAFRWAHASELSVSQVGSSRQGRSSVSWLQGLEVWGFGFLGRKPRLLAAMSDPEALREARSFTAPSE